MEKLLWDYETLSAAENDGALVSLKGEWRFLSNFWFEPVMMYGVSFPTNEHAFMAAKLHNAEKAENRPALLRFATFKSPSEAKKEGRRIQLRDNWENPFRDGLLFKEWVMLTLLRRKFSSPQMKAKLLSTEDRLILEGNTWGDRVWGAIDTKSGVEGANRLGQMLMAVRHELGGLYTTAITPSGVMDYRGKAL